VATAAAGAGAVVDADVAERYGAAFDLPRLDTDTVAAWLVAHPDERRAPAADLDPDAVTLYAATSGTTGVPKAAALTSRGLLAALGRLTLAPVGRQRGLRARRDRVLAALPLTHIMGFEVLVGSLCAGVELLHRGRFDAAEVLDLVERERPNVVIGVPTMYADLEAAGVDDRDCTSVQVWVSSADAMPADRARRFQRRGRLVAPRGRGVGTAAFVDVYGMVELSGAGAVRVYPPSPVRGVELPAVAVVLPGIEARVVDEDRVELGHGQLGELEFRGPGVLQRYEGRDDAGPDADGWFATGDHGRLYPGGVFAFAGRRRDRIKVGGFSVFPAEVEETLVTAPGVAEVALVGVPDERLGERPVALVVPTSAGAVDPGELLAWAGAHVAGYRRPTAVLVVEAIPRGNNDKVARGEATDLAVRLLEEGS
jgi:long-chain acyl-CoA synthetase